MTHPSIPPSPLIHGQELIPFDQFMDYALYHPEHGFYASGQTRTGTEGDFLTPVSPGQVLGQLLARQADELHEALARPTRFRLIEQGADYGNLTRDVGDAIRRNHPRLKEAAQFHLVEPHPRLAEQQKRTLGEFGLQAVWHSSWETVPGDGIPSLFYNCELVDSFPVRIFCFRKGTWRERLVGWTPSGWEWREGEVNDTLRAEIQRWHPPEIEDFTLELRPAAPHWIKSWAGKISVGLALTLDYGFPAPAMFSPERAAGTLTALRDHRKSNDPLADPGQQDLTAHVNFTELEELGSQEGWKSYGLVDFARGLTSLAAPLLKEDLKFSESWVRNFRHLTHPAFFGHSHHILVQGKSLPASFSPSILMKV